MSLFHLYLTLKLEKKHEAITKGIQTERQEDVCYRLNCDPSISYAEALTLNITVLNSKEVIKVK